MMRAHPSPGELEAFDRGLLRPTQWAEIERHVVECDACCRLLEEAPDDALVTLLKTAPDPIQAVTLPDSLALETPTARVSSAPRCSGEPPAELSGHPRYHVLERLGAGGMGTVFKAEHRLMRRIVALKVIHGDLLQTPGGVERFHQEVRAAALLSHPNIATAYDADQAGSAHFLVMEFVEGETLDRVLARRGPLPWLEALDLVRQVALGLRHAWERGMVHRDLKPANLLLTPQGQIKVLDFGLARLISESHQSARRVTPVDAVVGTPHYLAPEQAREPQTADVRADLYSLGCTWYEMLTGQTLFPQGALLQQLLAHQDQAPRPVTDFRPDLPAPLGQILHRLLEKDPAKRWQTPAELLKALEPWTNPQAAAPETRKPVWRRGPKWVIAATVSALLLCLLIWAGWSWLTPAPLPKAEYRAKDQVDASREQVTEKLSSARDQAIAWLTANNRFGPESRLIDKARQLSKNVAPGKVFVLQFSPTLLKSAQHTLLVGRQQNFFVFELPPGTLPIADSLTVLHTSAELQQELQTPLSVHLSDLRIDQKEIDGSLLTLSVAYRASTPVSGKLAARLTLYAVGKQTIMSDNTMTRKNLSGEGTLRFRYRSLYAEPSGLSEPIVFLLDLVALDDSGTEAKATVLSNDLAALVVDRKVILPKR